MTYKALVGISPSGAVTFVSQLYPGSLSDKEIVSRCGVLHPGLWEKGDSVMADRGFTIQELLDPLGVKVNIPAFLDGKEQLDKEDVMSQTISSVRIHVERIIARIKKFKVLKNEIPLNLNGIIYQIWTVACLLCNFMDPTTGVAVGLSKRKPDNLAGMTLKGGGEEQFVLPRDVSLVDETNNSYVTTTVSV